MKETPITPDALKELGFFIDNVGAAYSPAGDVFALIDGTFWIEHEAVPGIKTVEDVKTMLRFLGHEIKEEANAD